MEKKELVGLSRIRTDGKVTKIILVGDDGYYVWRVTKYEKDELKKHICSDDRFTIGKIDSMIARHFKAFYYSEDEENCYFSMSKMYKIGKLHRDQILWYADVKGYDVIFLGKRRLLAMPYKECWKLKTLRKTYRRLSEGKQHVRKEEVNLLERVEARFSDYYAMEDDKYCYFYARKIYRNNGWKKMELVRYARKVKGRVVIKGKKTYLAIPHDVCDPIKRDIEMVKKLK